MANEETGSNKKAGLIGCLVVLGLALVVAAACGICVATTGDGKTDEERAEEKKWGFHCLSEWDGNHDGFERLVKPYLNDPDSMETFSTRMGQLGSRPNGHSISMDFGARNAFGGMVRHTATGSVDHDSCEATLEAIN